MIALCELWGKRHAGILYIFSYLILLNSTNENIAIYYDTDIHPEQMHFDRSAAFEIASTNQIDIKKILLQISRDGVLFLVLS